MAANDFGVDPEATRYTTIITKWGERAFNCFVGAILIGGVLLGAVLTLFVPNTWALISGIFAVDLIALFGYYICNWIDASKGGGCVKN